MKRVSFLIDGFNLYHSLREIERLTKAPVKWLDVSKLCAGYLHAVRSAVGERVEIASITYFSALATHRIPSNPDVVARHQTYVAALESTGVDAGPLQGEDNSVPRLREAYQAPRGERD